ncbi:hypothetical protein [Hydrogenimonas sp.]
MKVLATYYIGIKDKAGKDLLILRRGETKEVSKKEVELLEKEAAGKYKVVEEVTK